MIICEKCGRELNTIGLVTETFDGGDTLIQHIPAEAYNGAVIVDTSPHWSGYEIEDADDMLDTIVCPHCGEFPFKNTEVQVHDVVRLVMFRKCGEVE